MVYKMKILKIILVNIKGITGQKSDSNLGESLNPFLLFLVLFRTYFYAKKNSNKILISLKFIGSVRPKMFDICWTTFLVIIFVQFIGVLSNFQNDDIMYLNYS